MPVDQRTGQRRRSKYPAEWRPFSRWVRFDRAGGRCECTGQCGLHQPKPIGTRPGEPRRCIEVDGEHARWMRQGTVVMLTVAHLNADGDRCQCDPLCAIPGHVLAMCQRCHLRYDMPRHRRAHFLRRFWNQRVLPWESWYTARRKEGGP